MNLTSLLGQDISKYLTLNYIPAQYRWLVPFGMLVFGLLMMFKSKYTWRFALSALGLIGGYFGMVYYGMPYLVRYAYPEIHAIFGSTPPSYLFPLIAAVIAAVLLFFLLRFAISAGIAYAAYYLIVMHFHTSIYMAIAIAFVVFFIMIVYLYRPFMSIVSKGIGAVILFGSLTMLHIPVLPAAVIAVALLLFSMVWWLYHRKIYKAIDEAKTKGKLEKKLLRKAARQDRKRMRFMLRGPQGGEKRMGIVGKIISVPKKVVTAPGRLLKKVTRKEEEVVTATETVTEAVVNTQATKPAPVTVVHKDGTTEKK